MAGKVLSFEEALQQQKQSECSCPNCVYISKLVKFFVEDIQDYDKNSKEFTEEVDSLIRYVQDETREETIRGIGRTLIQTANEISGYDEDEDNGELYDDDGGGFEGGYEE